MSSTCVVPVINEASRKSVVDEKKSYVCLKKSKVIDKIPMFETIITLIHCRRENGYAGIQKRSIKRYVSKTRPQEIDPKSDRCKTFVEIATPSRPIYPASVPPTMYPYNIIYSNIPLLHDNVHCTTTVRLHNCSLPGVRNARIVSTQFRRYNRYYYYYTLLSSSWPRTGS